MPITVECPDCKREYTVGENLVGQRVKCKNCGNVFPIEVPAPSPLSDIDPFAAADFESTAEEKPEPKKAKLHNPLELTASPKSENAKFATIPAFKGGGSSPAAVKAVLLVLALFLAMSAGMAIYWTINAYMDVKDSHLATTTVGHIWEWIFLFDVLLFALMGPLTWGAIWGSSKVLNFRMADLPYLRACAVVAVAAMIACCAEVSPGVLKTILFVLIAPAAYYVIKIAFDLDWAQSGIALAFGTGATLLGAFISSMLLGLVTSDNIFSAVDSARQVALSMPGQSSDQGSSTADSGGDATPLPPSQDPAVYDRFKDTVREKTTADISQSTREEHLPELVDLKRQLASLKAAFHNQPDWADQVRMIDGFEQRLMALPSSKFSDDIFTDSADVDDWSTGQLSRGKLGPEVSFRQFKFQPPLDMKLDLRSSEAAPDGLTWVSARSGDAKLSVRTIPRKNPRQRKPAVSDKPAVIRAAEAKGLLAVDGSNVIPTEGQINGLTATRMTTKDASHAVQYYIPAGDVWLVVSITPIGDPKYAKVVDAAARTLREIDTGEAAADPFGPALVAPRLTDDFDHASAILAREGAAGEDAVAALLQSDDHGIRQAALTYLRDHATNRSAAALRHAALDPELGMAELAKGALNRITGVATPEPAEAPTTNIAAAPADPAAAAEVTNALNDLRSTDAALRKRGIQQLIVTPPVASQRRAISSKLAAMLRNHDDCAPLDLFTQALIRWGDTVLAVDLLPLLKEGGDAEARHAAMKIEAALKLPGAATTIAKWLKTDPAPAANALVDIGPAAEPAVIASLKDEDPSVRIEASRLLAQIGTRKCIAELTRVAHDARDASAQQSAQAALKAVNARVSAEAAQPGDAAK